MAHFSSKVTELWEKVNEMSKTLKEKKISKEKLILFNWLQQFGSRFKNGFIITNPAFKENPFVFINDAFTEITGYHSDEVIGDSIRFLFGKETDIDLAREIAKALREAKPVNTEILHYKKDGTPFWNELIIQPLENYKGKILFNIAFIRDVTDLKKDETILKLQEKLLMDINQGVQFEELMKNVFSVVKSFLLSDAGCASAFKNPVSDWSVQVDEILPTKVAKVIRERVREDVNLVEGKSLIVQDVKPSMEHDYLTSWSVPIYDSESKLCGIFTAFMNRKGGPTDVQRQFLEKIVPVLQLTKTFFEQQNKVRMLAFTDIATGLPNSHAFLQQLKSEMNKSGNKFVAIIQPSEYSKIIDLYGRGMIDNFFVQLTRRIEKATIGKKDFVARFSGSSIILTNEIKGREDSEAFILKMKKIVSEPFVIDDGEMFLTLKIGVVLPSGEETSAEEIIRRADVAMTDALRNPGNNTSYYLDVHNEKMVRDMTIFNELTRALIADEIDVHLQPKVNLENGQIISFEALARWHSPVLGQVPPDVFISVAENIGKIIPLEISVLKKVLEWQRKRICQNKNVYQVAVNISVNHFFHPSFLSTLTGLSKTYGVDAQYIRLEIIESIGLVDFDRAKEIFNDLREARFDVSIDDFGVGYSSLSYLPQLNVNELKIDRSFISALDEPETLAVVTTIIQLANNLNLSTVAEGIEYARHIETLLSLGCKIGQGYHFYKPMALQDIDLILEQN